MAENDELGAALAALRTRQQGLRVVVTAVREAVEHARRVGVSSTEIGEVFGVSGSEARQTFGGEE